MRPCEDELFESVATDSASETEVLLDTTGEVQGIESETDVVLVVEVATPEADIGTSLGQVEETASPPERVRPLESEPLVKRATRKEQFFSLPESRKEKVKKQSPIRTEKEGCDNRVERKRDQIEMHKPVSTSVLPHFFSDRYRGHKGHKPSLGYKVEPNPGALSKQMTATPMMTTIERPFTSHALRAHKGHQTELQELCTKWLPPWPPPWERVS